MTTETLGLLLIGEVQAHLTRLRRHTGKGGGGGLGQVSASRRATFLVVWWSRCLPHKQRHLIPLLNPLKTPHETTHVSGEGDEELPGEVDAEVVVQLLLKRHLALLWGGGEKGQR